MNNKGKTNTVVILIVVAIAALAIFLIFGGKGLIPTKEGDITNGWWNSATGECWLDESHGPGVYAPIEGEVPSMFQCCFDREGYQVDCNDPTIALGPKQIGAPFAFYGEVAPGTAGMFSVSHGITITNTGNIPLSQAWIESASWSPSHVALTTAYSTVVGAINGKGPIVVGGGFAIWSTGTIDLQDVGTPTGQLYTLDLFTKASATGLPDSSKNTPATMFVQEETIGFSVDINIGA